MNKWHDKWHDIDKWAVEELCSCTCCVYQPYIVKDQMKKLGEGTQGVSSNMEGNWGSNLAIVSIKYNVLLVYTRAARPTTTCSILLSQKDERFPERAGKIVPSTGQTASAPNCAESEWRAVPRGSLFRQDRPCRVP